MEYSSYEIDEFNLQEGAIKLNGICGMIRIQRSEDKKMILVCDSSHQLIDYDSGEAQIADLDAILGFALDVGIRKRTRLTYDNGFYSGTALLASAHLNRPKRQSDYDEHLLQKAIKRINEDFQSGDLKKELSAVKLNHLFKTYNRAWILFPDFFNESYLGLMRIIDASITFRGARGFSAGASDISTSLNKIVFDEIAAIPSFTDRLKVAEDIFTEQLAKAKKEKEKWAASMEGLDTAGRFVFSCMYSAYQYRNEFVHFGFPFPNNPPIGNSYLSPILGESLLRRHSLLGVQPADLLDIHEVVSNPDQVENFKNKFFLLIPSWEFMRLLAKEVLIKQVEFTF